MQPMRRWVVRPQTVLAIPVLAGALWVAVTAAEESGWFCPTDSAAPRSMACELLTTWTGRLAAMQLAQYPPGYGEPTTY